VQLVEEIQKRRYFISTEWVEEDDDDEDNEQDENNQDAAANAGTDQPVAKKVDDTTVRLLDYACGTGLISRVR
jgi:hypothetical protein